MMKFITFVCVAYLTFSCSSQEKIENDNNLTGKWAIKQIRYIGKFDGDGSKLENISFVGPSAWAESKDKYFNFETDSTCVSDIFEDEIMNFRYINEGDEIDFQLIINNKNINQGFKVKKNIENSNEMKWVIDDLMEVTLGRVSD